jgi:hypothetical protein
VDSLSIGEPASARSPGRHALTVRLQQAVPSRGSERRCLPWTLRATRSVWRGRALTGRRQRAARAVFQYIDGDYYVGNVMDILPLPSVCGAASGRAVAARARFCAEPRCAGEALPSSFSPTRCGNPRAAIVRLYGVTEQGARAGGLGAHDERARAVVGRSFGARARARRGAVLLHPLLGGFWTQRLHTACGGAGCKQAAPTLPGPPGC